VKNFEGQPFSLIGACGRTNELRSAIESGRVTWPSFDCRQCEDSPAEIWGVTMSPANILIDKNGIVQAVNEFDEDALTARITGLLSLPTPTIIGLN